VQAGQNKAHMIGFVGLSHLGLNYSLASAAKGFETLGFDPDPRLVAGLSAGSFPIEEPGFRELHAANRDRLRYTHDPAEISKCDVVFYALDIPTNDRNESDPSRLLALIEATAPYLADGASAVVMSQVRPGFMRKLAGMVPRRAGRWYYQVETLVFGAAVQRAMEPERFIVGAAGPGAQLPPAYARWLGNFGCPILVMRYESAELAKIAINLFLVSTVSTTNVLAEICESIGADWSEIAPALRLDRRIGPHAYLKPGLGIAGGNLERDLVTVTGLAAEHGTEAGVVGAWQKNSAHAKGWALRALHRGLLRSRASARIALWGLAYKQDTHSLKNSAAIELINALPGCEFRGYDPAAVVEPGRHPNLSVCKTAMEALTGADALAIMTPWKEFGAISPATIASALGKKPVLDPYGVLERKICAVSGLEHIQIGAR
jgi:UDPglucose 6-dehydrogenase